MELVLYGVTSPLVSFIILAIFIEGSVSCKCLSFPFVLILFGQKQGQMGQYDKPSVHGCEPVDGVLVIHSSNQINIATFFHQMGDKQIS